MATIEEIIGKCSVEELRFAAYDNGVSDKGTKAGLVSRLSSRVPPRKVLNSITNEQLQAILSKYRKPTSGNKHELVKRILPLIKTAKRGSVHRAKASVKTQTQAKGKKADYEKGRRFEEQVAAWARRQYKPDFAKPDWVRGAVGVRPHQVDVHVRKMKRGRLDCDDIWIECKNLKETIKRTHIYKLVNDAQMVYKAFRKGVERFYFNGLMVVSTSRFDIDALNYADEYGVLCVCFDGKTYKKQNEPRNWLSKPRWLQQVM
jgi:hypothetical protein